ADRSRARRGAPPPRRAAPAPGRAATPTPPRRRPRRVRGAPPCPARRRASAPAALPALRASWRVHLAEGLRGTVEDHVEVADGDAERRRALLAGAVLEEPQAERPGVARAQLVEAETDHALEVL